ncbi:MAG: phosphotransferase [Candidatus Hydrogenedentes bacterium]|nr:phosphotransferase [Candidatus Hydrogenedentota bacterium]
MTTRMAAESATSKSCERYCTFQRGNEFGFATRTQHASVMRALLDRWNCEPFDAMGRGGLYTFPVLLRKGMLREYRRGGIARRLLREGALTNRPIHEWSVLNWLFNAGFPVPDPLGVVWRKRGLLYTGAIATQFMESTNLVEYLKSPDVPREDLLREVGTRISRMHELCVFHADLHAGNILIASKPADANRVYFVDFDNARIASVSMFDRARNLLRLRRSFLKHGLRLTDFEQILRGYGPIAIPEWLQNAYDIRGAISDRYHRGAAMRVV